MSRFGACIVISVALVCSLMADIHLDRDLAEDWGAVSTVTIVGAAVLWFLDGES